MSVGAVSGPEAWSARDHWAAINTHLEALALMPTVDAAAGDHLDLTLQALVTRRRMDAVAARTLDAMACSGEWSSRGGARTAAAWLSGATTEAPGVVKELLANGAFTRRHADVEAAAVAGDISQAHVSAWRSVRGKYTRIGMLLDAATDHILTWAGELSPKGFHAALVEFAHRLDPDLVDDVEAKKRRRVFLDANATLDGYVHVAGLLDPVTGGMFLQALESARRAGTDADADVKGEGDTGGEGDDTTSPDTDTDTEPLDPHADPAHAGRSIGERNPEALHRILAAAAAATGDNGLPAVNGTRPRISVNVDLDTLTGEKAAGMGWLQRFGLPTTPITSKITQMLACDATLAPLIVDREGQIATVLPGTRTIAPALRTAILTRDHHCRFPRCRARIDEVHHITFYSHGGQTTRSNLVGLCYYHHQLIHTGGWRITGDPDGELRFTHPAHYNPHPSTPTGLEDRATKRRQKHLATQLLPRERQQPPDPPF